MKNAIKNSRKHNNQCIFAYPNMSIACLVQKNQPLFSHPNEGIASLVQKSNAYFVTHMGIL
jgi:hypothetical protein